MVDLISFVQKEIEKISEYYEEGSSDSFSQKNFDHNWIAEQILLLFSQWTTGITRTILRQDILNQARTSRSRQHVKPDATHHPVLHGIIQAIDIIKSPFQEKGKNISAAVVHIKQDGYNLIIQAALHGALLPFVGRFITGGRQIHFSNIRFSNDCLIPNQLCVIDLKRTKEDINFIKQSQIIPIPQINEDTNLDSILLRVESPTKDGITMSDCTNTIELFLEEERKPLKQLLNFGDVILFYKPWVQQLDDGNTVLSFGPNSVLFRVPITVGSNFSQVSHAQSSLTQDGLSFRNSSACRAICGTVVEISSTFDDKVPSETSKWSSSTLIIRTEPINEKVTVNINAASDVPYEVLRIVASLRVYHFVWIFGLIQEEQDNLSFTSETTLYNTSQLYSIIASAAVIPKALNSCSKYLTFVGRAVIIKVLTCDVKYKHKFCNTLLRTNNCPSCPTCRSRIYNQKNIDLEFLFKFEIDDGSCNPLTVHGLGSKFSFWSTKPNEWRDASKEKRDKLLASIIGREYVFVLSMANEEEFCGFGDDYNIWRVDQCIRPVGDIEREVIRFKKWSQKLDDQKSSLF